MNTPTTLGELTQLIELGIQENLHLDYKASRALLKKNRDEIIKDVSAFANSDGGILVYGINEKDHLPEALDEGVPNKEMSREWIEQILNSNITPPISGIEIYQIPRAESHSYYVLSVPKSYRGPHQASDKKYYKRYNFTSCPMDHYEIQDIASRRQRVPRAIVVDVEVDIPFTRLVVANVGSEPVTDVTFMFPPNFNWPNSEMPKALSKGIRYFPPGRKFRFFYGGTMELLDADSQNPATTIFDIEVRYQHPDSVEPVSEIFNFDLHDFLGTSAEKDSAGALVKAIERGFDKLKTALQALNRR